MLFVVGGLCGCFCALVVLACGFFVCFVCVCFWCGFGVVCFGFWVGVLILLVGCVGVVVCGGVMVFGGVFLGFGCVWFCLLVFRCVLWCDFLCCFVLLWGVWVGCLFFVIGGFFCFGVFSDVCFVWAWCLVCVGGLAGDLRRLTWSWGSVVWCVFISFWYG